MAATEGSQQTVIDFLASPAAHGGAPVTRIDTHAASVFLAGKRALKIKRAVRFPFLDFSTLAKRKAACEAEIAVNRPFAPAIYRGVVAITRGSHGSEFGLEIGGGGEPVEWAVVMARFDETKTLDCLAERGEIDERLADALGRAVACAHAAAPAGQGFVEALDEVIAQNDAELRACDLFATPQVVMLSAAARTAFASVRPLLGKRERSGLVRRCHGDLHLGNIVLLGDQPTLFDAIEFDPKIATGDVLYDLAFLLMDLIERRLGAAANIVFNRYLTETRRDDDLDALAALPLFLSLRAAIRAKVTAARAKGHELHSDKRGEAAQSARDYFALAQELIAPPQPQLIAVGGLSGTGKSLLARALAPHVPPAPGAVLLRSDVERKALYGAAETERLPQPAYAREVTAKVYAMIEAKAARVVAAGHSAIVDAVFADPRERAAIERAAGAAAFHGLFLVANLDTRVARAGARTGDASDADAAVARAQEQYDLGALDWATVDASGAPEETLRRARAVLKL